MVTRRVGAVFVVFAACAAMVALAGCVTHGHRKVTIGFLGQTITVEDQAYPNSEGNQEYRSTFDGSAWDLIFGWMQPGDEADEGAAMPGTAIREPDDPAPGGG